MRRILLAGLILLAAAPAWAQAIESKAGPEEKEDDTKPTLTLVLHPAPEPQPALKYQFLPTVIERHHGNAAVYYGKVTAEQTGFFGDNELWSKINKWSDVPLAELREAKKSGECPLPKDLFMLDWAARCDTCDWQLPIREYPFYEIPLPDIQQTRRFARLLAANTRMRTAEGEYEEAVDALTTGYSLAQDVSHGQCFVCGLVGVAIAGIMSDQVETFIQQSDAPNLYWALATLPRPFIDLREAMDVERDVLYLSLPELQQANDVQHDADYWSRVVDQLSAFAAEIMRFDGVKRREHHWEITLQAIRVYPSAKQHLVTLGFSPQQVEAMPVPEVVGRYTLATYHDLRDDVFKWFYVPYWKATEGADKADRRLRQAVQAGHEIIPLASLLMPAMYQARDAVVRCDRQIAALTVVEALRMHAANSDGGLPDRLDDVTVVPIPDDPVTGKPFEYELHDDTATLSGPPLTGERLRWEIKIAK